MDGPAATPEAIELFNTFVFALPEDRAKFEEVLKIFDEHCISKKNETYERYVCRSRLQHQGESFDNFLTDLKIKAQSLNFSNLRESMIKDQIVFGTNEKKLQEKLLRETDLRLNSELAGQQVLTFREPAHRAAHQENQAVNAVFVKGKPQRKFTSSDTRNKNSDKEMFTGRDVVKNTHQDNVLPMEKCVQNVKDKTILPECVSLRRRDRNVHTVQEDTDD